MRNRDLKVGVLLPQFTSDREVFVDGIRRAEAAGFDSVWVFDHLWPLGGNKERPILECWIALAYAAAATTHITIGTLVTRSTLRHPALLAKMAATVAAVAPGRLVVGVGSGDRASRPENEAFGLPYLAGTDRTDQLASTLEVLCSYLRDEVVSHSDRFVTIAGLPASPRGSRASVWVGGRSRALLEVAGRLADGWNAWGCNVDEFDEAAATVRSVAGSRPVELSWGAQVILGRDEQDALRKLGSRNPNRFLVGGPERVADELNRFVARGARHLICAFPHAADPDSYELLANEVRPRLTLGRNSLGET